MLHFDCYTLIAMRQCYTVIIWSRKHLSLHYNRPLTLNGGICLDALISTVKMHSCHTSHMLTLINQQKAG